MVKRYYGAIALYMLAQTTCLMTSGWCAPAEDDALALIAAQEVRLPALKAQLDEVRAGGTPVPYPQADLLIAERFCAYCREDVAHGRPQRALNVAGEVALLIDRAAAEMRDGLAVPVLKRDTPIEIQKGSFWAECEVEGQTEYRPVFLTGYGHSAPAVEDLPLWGRIGINLLQIEIGPKSTVFEGGTREDEVRSVILPALDRARDNGVRVDLLTSPHYFPEWAFATWPALKVASGVLGTQPFLKSSVEAPQALAIYQRHLRTLIPLVKDHPALLSICLSNEPSLQEGWKDPARLALWHDYLRRIHGEIATLNAAWNASYASFEEIPQTPFDYKEPTARLYDSVRFNQERFSGWHRWMVEIIHKMRPDLPCHAKVMKLVDDGDYVFWGVDPLQFAELSQINGNDCYFTPAEGEGWFASNFLPQNENYDLQRSMKRLPIFNSENHIIRDRTKYFVPAEHVYSAIWQGAVHGQGASATWIWQRTYDPEADAEGLILHRATCTAAMSRCALDLMRLSREMAAIQNAVPEVAILFSHAARLQDNEYIESRNRVYEALNFCGVPIAFVTDEQAATGKLKQYKILIVPQAKAALLAAIEAIHAYAQGGGRVLVYGKDNLTRDEYGHKVAPPKRMKKLPETQGVELRDALIRLLAKADVKTPFALRAKDNTIPYGVEWRCAVIGGRNIVNIVNYAKVPIAIELPKGTWRELITRRDVKGTLHLASNAPLLIERPDLLQLNRDDNRER
jgi:hypothetical protein